MPLAEPECDLDGPQHERDTQKNVHGGLIHLLGSVPDKQVGGNGAGERGEVFEKVRAFHRVRCL